MSVWNACGAESPHCDCGRTDNECKFKFEKQRATAKILNSRVPKSTVNSVRKKESQKDKKKRRKKGRR
jgi:hypothetical protein